MGKTKSSDVISPEEKKMYDRVMLLIYGQTTNIPKDIRTIKRYLGPKAHTRMTKSFNVDWSTIWRWEHGKTQVGDYGTYIFIREWARVIREEEAKSNNHG